MVIALSKFFRISITDETNRISLAEEVEHAKNYLLIQQIRYHNQFKFVFEIDENVGVPPCCVSLLKECVPEICQAGTCIRPAYHDTFLRTGSPYS